MEELILQRDKNCHDLSQCGEGLKSNHDTIFARLEIRNCKCRGVAISCRA